VNQFGNLAGLFRRVPIIFIWREKRFLVRGESGQVRFEVLTAVKISMSVFLVVTACTSALNMEVVCSSETLVSTYRSTRRYNSEDQHDKCGQVWLSTSD
jgi:hypothetical protein